MLFVRTCGVGRVPADADLHAIALALDAPALVERGEAARERWHVVPLAPFAWLLRDTGLHDLRAMLRDLACARPGGDIPFAGGIVTLLSYDVAHEIESLPRTTDRRDDIPWIAAACCEAALLLPVGGGEAQLAWLSRLDDRRARELAARCAETLRCAPAPAVPGRPLSSPQALWPRDDHEAAVREVIENVRAGEIYQANLTQRFECAWQGSALPLHGVLRRTNPSPFSGWMRDPEGRWEMVSGSPERFVRLADGELTTEPIKGTRPLPQGRETPEEELARLAAELLGSAKDRAEHVMMVDLHRNDLGRIAATGSVHVRDMMRIDRRSHVLQAVADIRARLLPGLGPVDVIEAMFPAGSVTGVPKIRAMEILDSLERFDRGPYTGSFGFIAPWGDMDLNVLIRSAWRSGGRLAYAAGGGIVVGSDPALEYAESLAKAEAMRLAVASLLR